MSEEPSSCNRFMIAGHSRLSNAPLKSIKTPRTYYLVEFFTTFLTWYQASSNDRCIAITQPRRVAATAMARRVAYETGLGCPIVAHSIRYESTANRDSKIIFMTDGVLFKEIQRDALLRRFSVVIIDEAHERTLYTDVLLGILSRLVPLRFKNGDPLRLVVMSATLRIEDFIENSHLFRTPPPVIKIDARQYDVAVHWSRFTEDDYVEAAFKKVCKIHAQLPAGAILVFLTGK